MIQADFTAFALQTLTSWLKHGSVGASLLAEMNNMYTEKWKFSIFHLGKQL